MTTGALREQLQQQINELPDEIVREVADFTAFVLARRRLLLPDGDWTEAEWQQFALSQFLHDTDNDVEYSLEDAQEVFRR